MLLAPPGPQPAPRRDLRCGHRWHIALVDINPIIAGGPPAPTDLSAHPIILLVEDEAAVRGVARRMLQRFGYQVQVAGSGEEALRWLESRAHPPDLIITDVVLPGMSGGEVAARARARFPGARVLFMSGYTADAVAQHGAADGCMDLIDKPFSPAELMLRVQCAIAARGDLLAPDD